MNGRPIARQRALMWTALLVSPVAWAVSLVVMLSLTRAVCQGMSHSVLVFAGIVCALLALSGSAAARGALARRAGGDDADETAAFVLRLAFWGGLLFSLVIIISLAPTALLTPCPS